MGRTDLVSSTGVFTRLSASILGANRAEIDVVCAKN